MITEVFCAFLLDTWNDAPQVPKEDERFVSLLAKRAHLMDFAKSPSHREHPHMNAFLNALERAHDSKDTSDLPLFTLAIEKVRRLSEKPYLALQWRKEVIALAAALGREVTFEQRAGAVADKEAFTTLSRRFTQLFGGTRQFKNGTLHDSSWRGRVQAFAQRITL